MTLEEIKAGLEDLEAMKITLDEDPTAAGLDAFNEKLAKLDAYHERVSSMLQKAIQIEGEAEIAKFAAQHAYDVAFNIKLASNATVRGMKSNDLRKSTLDAELEELVKERDTAVLIHARAEIYLKRVQQRYKDIGAKSERLYTQLDVVKQLMRLDPNLRTDFFEEAGKRTLTLKKKE